GAGEMEEALVAAGAVETAGAGEIDEDVGREAADLEGEADEFADGARAGGVAHVAVDEAGVFEHSGGGRGLGGHGQVGEEAALGVRKGARDEMERRKGDERVAETAKPVDQDPPNLTVSHDSQCRR